MKTLDIQKAPVVPPHCLWVSGLLLESGCRASAGLPHLQRVRQTAGNRLAMGDKASGAWGAPDADPLHGLAVGVASLWAGSRSQCAATSQTREGSLSVGRREFILWAAVPRCVAQVRPAAWMDPQGLSSPQISGGADVASGNTSPAHGRMERGAGEDPALKTRVLFSPKPEPWGDAGADGGAKAGKDRKPSFCRKVVAFSPSPRPVE